jgi:hypothetical protein
MKDEILNYLQSVFVSNKVKLGTIITDVCEVQLIIDDCIYTSRIADTEDEALLMIKHYIDKEF